MKSKLEQLVNQWIEGDLEPEDAETLRGLLAEDASARETCYGLMLLDQLLASREEALASAPIEPVLDFPKRKFRGPRAAIAAVAGLAALIVAGFWFAGGPDGKELPATTGPTITASSDSRITIAQREDRSQWKPGELLRLERGTAAIQLGKGVLVRLEGPAAIELANPEGDVRLFGGNASFLVDPGARQLVMEAPGGVIRGSGVEFVCRISQDQSALLEIISGEVEINSHGDGRSSVIRAGEAVQVEANGTITPAARPRITSGVELPEELALYSDDFNAAEGTGLEDHLPEIGQRWEILPELKPTVLRKKRLDTSEGARRLLARLAPHDPGSANSVYVFSFSLVPPARSHDKASRMDGIESIAIVDSGGHELCYVVAEAVNTHRWQLKGDGQASPLTPVCALWDHQLTICYGLNGHVTLHDGASAQAPVIASLWITKRSPAGGILISNRTGGDLAFRRIGASLLRFPSLKDK